MTTAETILNANEFYTGSLSRSNETDHIGVAIEEGLEYTIEISTYYRAGVSARLLENLGSGLIEWSDTHGLDSTAYFSFVATETTTVYVALSAGFRNVGRYDVSVYPVMDNFSTNDDDDLVGSDGRNRIDLQKGDDRYYAFGDSDTVFAGGGDDIVFAGSGHDFVRGEEGHDQISGEAGNDRLYGGGGNDTLDGGSGDDALDGDRGRDALYGSSGDDVLDGGSGADIIDGGAGIDLATFTDAGGGVSLNLGAGVGTRGNANGDTYFGIENVTATDFSDFVVGSSDDNHLIGGRGRDELRGGAGNDVLEGGGGRDIIKGGAGTDTASFVTASSGVTLNLTTGVGTRGNADGDVYISIENVVGSLFDDTLIGSAGANTLNGGRGQDLLRGSAGDDTLVGARDDDILVGGSGSDVFLFRAHNGDDVITDFSRARDLIAFRIAELEFADLNISNVDGDAVIDYGSGSILLEGVSASLITEDHFDFG